MKLTRLKKTVFAAALFALGAVLPLLTGQLKEIGDSLLPMHLPVFIGGLLLGAEYAAPMGALLPFFRALTFGMPAIYPNAVWMSAELLTYGLVSGILYKLLKRYNVAGLYTSLVGAMLCGRVVWGMTKALLLGIGGRAFGISAFFVGGFVDAIPGILIQLVLVPLIVKAVEYKTK